MSALGDFSFAAGGGLVFDGNVVCVSGPATRSPLRERFRAWAKSHPPPYQTLYVPEDHPLATSEDAFPMEGLYIFEPGQIRGVPLLASVLVSFASASWPGH